jgi:valyl-tRNA synthetase
MTETTQPETTTQPDALAKTFEPGAIEARWYAHWEANGLFRPERPDAAPYTIVNPPPNVTGSLHIGHALDNTLQDIVIRYERLRGKDALWVVGTDHAGIATQMVVERQMEARQDKRSNYTREQFVEKVWEWKHESGGTITGQLRRLGCSMDWSREQFTMDPHFTRAVVKVFVDLYNQGLIYRDKRLVNWDPKLKTAISDLEVETREIKGGFWHFRYPLADGVTLDNGADHIVVATTRPETMLADMAVAVNADDPRYASVIGKEILQPLTGRRFRIVADEHADPELGSGAVKITPGHDFNDFEVGKRAGIKAADMLNMFDAEARVVQTADGLVPDKYLGLDRFVVREMIVADMKAAGCLVPHIVKDKDGNETEQDFEPRTIQTPFGDRGGVVIEPWLTDQWYVDAATLAKPAIEAVKSGAIEIVPKTWEKTYFNWMENIQPWCVSRQLWWGHRIPAWYGPNLSDGNANYDLLSLTPDQHFVAQTLDEAINLAKVRYGEDFEIIEISDPVDVLNASLRGEWPGNRLGIWRDPDVLDTWFSSALWPFATLGWPEESPSPAGEGLLAKHYPNDLLISGFDILFFWDARMAMQGIHFMKEVPWKRLYLHGLVRAADGQKMSKSKGNVVDPLGLIDQYGADALRFFMAAMESQGRDVKMDERRVEGYRNFATKLWNAARFCQANGINGGTSFKVDELQEPVNRWIVNQVSATRASMDLAMQALRFDDFANEIYHFTWSSFCDRYIEVIKTFLHGEEPLADETRRTCGWVLDQILMMLHPIMPFITEEIWSSTGARETELIIHVVDEARTFAPEFGDANWLFEFVDQVRSARAELGVPPGARVDCYFTNMGQSGRISRYRPVIERMCRIASFHENLALPTVEKATISVQIETYELDLRGVIDIAAEKARLEKALAASQKEAKSLEGRLSNPAFAEKAKPEAVEKARADHAHHAAEAMRLAAALARLG